MRITGFTNLISEHSSTLARPRALFIEYCSNRRIISPVGYFFDSVKRRLTVAGATRETLFWDVCKECPLYQRLDCSGGYKTLVQYPQAGTYSLTNSTYPRTIHYNKDFCSLHYNTDFLRQKTAANVGFMDVDILPHVAFVYNNNLYWYLFRFQEESGVLEFLPYRLFNTYPSGRVCHGGSYNDSNDFPGRYESFFGAMANSDLCPATHSNIVTWLRSFSVNALLETSSGSNRWRPARSYIVGEFSEVFPTEMFVLPPIYNRFTSVTAHSADIPERFRSLIEPHINGAGVFTLPILREEEDSSLHFPFGTPEDAITPENFPELHRLLQGN